MGLAREAPGGHAPDDRALAPLEIQNENVALLVSIQLFQCVQPIELGSVRTEHLIAELSADQQYPAFHKMSASIRLSWHASSRGILEERRASHWYKSENLRQQMDLER